MAEEEETTVEKRRILIVEDERDIASLLELHLNDANFDVSLAADGHEGMHLAFSRQWDLVILDIRLPGPDGLTICRAITTRNGLCSHPDADIQIFRTGPRTGSGAGC